MKGGVVYKKGKKNTFRTGETISIFKRRGKNEN